MFLERVKAWFSKGGLLEKAGFFSYRSEQERMALSVGRSLTENEPLFIEAPTGTGKTLAYLIPGLLWFLETGEKIAVSTHTIHLQEQILKKDLPPILPLLGLSLEDVFLLKGMHNYACLLKKESLLLEKGDPSVEDLSQWIHSTSSGEKSDLSPLLQNSFHIVHADNDTCLKKKCPFYNDCFYFKARLKAEKAPLLLLNHALSCQESYRATSPLSKRKIFFDEAHHLPSVAKEQFAFRYRPKDFAFFLQILHTLEAEKLPLPLLKRLSEKAQNFKKETLTFFSNLKDSYLKEGSSRELAFDRSRDPHPETFLPLFLEIQTLFKEIRAFFIEEDKKGEVLETLKILESRLADWIFHTQDLTEENTQILSLVEENRAVIFKSTPLFPEKIWKTQFFEPFSPLLFCSATLAVNEDFSFYQERLAPGKPSLTEKLQSPFALEKQASFFHCVDTPPPEAPEFIDAIYPLSCRVIEKTKGGVLFLFTSYKKLSALASLLEKRYGNTHPVFIQNKNNKTHLIEEFKRHGNAILMGVSSFWEGIDIPGQALRAVVLTQLPFPYPKDPWVQGLDLFHKKNGSSGFEKWVLPEGLRIFKQGIGRLIRTPEDRGLIVCFDSRLSQKEYGKFFLEQLSGIPIHPISSQKIK